MPSAKYSTLRVPFASHGPFPQFHHISPKRERGTNNRRFPRPERRQSRLCLVNDLPEWHGVTVDLAYRLGDNGTLTPVYQLGEELGNMV